MKIIALILSILYTLFLLWNIVVMPSDTVNIITNIVLTLMGILLWHTLIDIFKEDMNP